MENKKEYIGSGIFYEGKEAIAIEQYNKELEDADAEIDRGEFYTHKEATEVFEKVVSAAR